MPRTTIWRTVGINDRPLIFPATKSRKFMPLVAASAASGFVVSSPAARTVGIPKIRAIVLDGFITLNPRSVFAMAEVEPEVSVTA